VENPGNGPPNAPVSKGKPVRGLLHPEKGTEYLLPATRERGALWSKFRHLTLQFPTI
jgi:hypothetical protein